MGTWSIEPSSSLVSIDQNGELTYQEHTEDTDYTIKYEDDVCGTISKSIKLKGCTPPPPPGKHVRVPLTFVMNVTAGGTEGETYVFNSLEFSVAIKVAGEVVWSDNINISCPCTQGSACTEGYELSTSISYTIDQYIDESYRLSDCEIQVDMRNAVGRDKTHTKECGYHLTEYKDYSGTWTKSGSTFTKPYAEYMTSLTVNCICSK